MDISIIVPIYNLDKYLSDCLDSLILGIDNLDAEILLIDDGSTDNSGSIANEYALSDSRFCYHYIENHGVSYARNFGVKLAKGKYIAFADSDDIVAPKIYRRLFDVCERNNTKLAVCDAARISGEKVSASQLHLRAFNKIDASITHISRHTSFVYDVCVWNKLLLRDWYIHSNISFIENHIYEDIPWNISVHCAVDAVSVIRATGYYWRIRKNAPPSISQTRNYATLIERIEMLKAANSVLQSSPVDIAVYEAFLHRVLSIDFVPFFDRLHSCNDDEKDLIVSSVRSFYSSLDFSSQEISRLSLINQQCYWDVMNNDVNNLERLSNYRSKNYHNSPIILIDDHTYQRLLPPHLFSLNNYSAENEFSDVPPMSLLESISFDDKELILEGYLYFKGLSYLDSECQKLDMYILNEFSGEQCYLSTKSQKNAEITKNHGVVFNYDDYSYYNYNYDYAGFRAQLKLDDIADLDQFGGRNVFIIKYTCPVDSGSRLLRGITPSAREALMSTEICLSDFCISFDVDIRGEMSLFLTKNLSNPDESSSHMDHMDLS